MVTKELIKKEIIDDLKHKHYGIFGKHSAVEICEWNKKAIRGEGVCYKEHFYNVECHRCAQITPTVLWCHNNCIFCWRPAEYMTVDKFSESDYDDPKEIIDGLFAERKKLLSGFGGFKKVDKKKLKEAEIPSHVAISLSGEPTIYKDLDKMILELKSRKEIKTIFVVTNGLEPENLEKLNKNKALPTQLYLSFVAPNKELHLKINRPKIKDSWERLMKTIDIFPKLKCRKVIRFTLIKGLNDDLKYLPEFIKIFEKSKTDFIEIKSYMFLGYSRKTMAIENMPSFDECMNYAKELEKVSKDFKISDSCKPSRIILLKNKNSKVDNFIIEKK
ncbi:MAG: 4-demethylwyosine synthase TYW1 [archaeon]|jgi:tRNA wybutosine-synthesizing protein 1